MKSSFRNYTLAVLFSISGGNTYAFNSNFIWGTSVTGSMVEGQEGSNAKSDWTLDSFITPGNGVGFWRNYTSDLELAASLGFKSFKISLSWEKINPSPKVFDLSVLAHYRNIFSKMQSLGIKPIIVLHQWTHPDWFHKNGGWLSPEGPIYFLEYTKKVFESLSPVCETWVIFDDPFYFATKAYLDGEFPPFLRSSEATFEALYQMVRAYQITSSYIQESQGAPSDDNNLKGVGIAQSFSDRDGPDSDSDFKFLDSYYEAFLTALEKNKLTISLPDLENDAWVDYSRELPSKDLPPWMIKAPLNWIGINLLQFTLPFDTSLAGPNSNKSTVMRIRSKWPRTPLWIASSGVSLKNTDDESKRTHYYKILLDELKNLDYIRGFFAYSFLDHFNWKDGWNSSYGLVKVDPNTEKRTPKESAFFLSSEIKKLKAK